MCENLILHQHPAAERQIHAGHCEAFTQCTSILSVTVFLKHLTCMMKHDVLHTKTLQQLCHIEAPHPAFHTTHVGHTQHLNNQMILDLDSVTFM